MQNFLHQIGLSEITQQSISQPTNNFTATAFNTPAPILNEAEIKKLYTYPVPQASANGGCSIIKEPAPEPHNLAINYQINEPTNWQALAQNSHTQRLWQLGQIITNLQKATGADWLGIYRKTTTLQGETILLKESYYGEFSRAEFPLTAKFAKTSNNSTVGLTGKAVVVNSVDEYKGPYYQCDAKVQSEFCCPIFDNNNQVIGIIDAEAFDKDFFTSERIIEIAQVCIDLGKYNFGL